MENQTRPKLQKWVIILIAVLAAATVVAVAALLMNGYAGITVAGQLYERNTAVLELENTAITTLDVMQFKKFPALQTLRLEGCILESADLSMLLQPSLTVLELPGCGLTQEQVASLDFSVCTGLQVLSLKDNPGLTELTALKCLAATLTELDISGTGVTQLSGLGSFSQLRTLRANGLGLTTLKPLTGCTGLTHLEAGSNQLSDLAGLENTAALKFLFLNDNVLTGISQLSGTLGTLERLYLNNNQLTNLTLLDKAVRLQYLSADHNRLTNLSALTGITELRGLSAAGNQLMDFNGIAGHSKLVYLNLSANLLMDSPQQLTFQPGSTVVLDLSGNFLTELSLPTDCSYACLDISGNEIEDLGGILGLTGEQLLMDYDPGADYSAMRIAGFARYHISGCPAEQRQSLRTTMGAEKVSFSEESARNISSYIPDSIRGVPEYYKGVAQ